MRSTVRLYSLLVTIHHKILKLCFFILQLELVRVSLDQANDSRAVLHYHMIHRNSQKTSGFNFKAASRELDSLYIKCIYLDEVVHECV